MIEQIARLDGLLAKMLSIGGSDLHLKSDNKPRIRIDGEIEDVGEEMLDDAFFEAVFLNMLTPDKLGHLREEKELDGYYADKNGNRFRFNIFFHLGGYGAVFRTIPAKIASIDELRLPLGVKKFVEFERGLVLVTGTTGSGKSTTLAAIIDAINSSKKRHIITVEDPIEFVHRDKKSIIEQRNVGEHTNSFHNALKSALREDPDVILVGEMRDAQTVEIALHAANSGHLVFSTLHTLDAKETIDRIIGIFPTFEQNRIRMTLSSVLQGILSQRLVKRIGGGRRAAIEVLIATNRIKGMIKEFRDAEILDAIECGDIYGMQSFDQALLKLYKEGEISIEEALGASSKPDDLRLAIANVSKTKESEIIAMKNSESVKKAEGVSTEKELPVLKLKRG